MFKQAWFTGTARVSQASERKNMMPCQSRMTRVRGQSVVPDNDRDKGLTTLDYLRASASQIIIIINAIVHPDFLHVNFLDIFTTHVTRPVTLLQLGIYDTRRQQLKHSIHGHIQIPLPTGNLSDEVLFPSPFPHVR